jgi:hypothetical protein
MVRAFWSEARDFFRFAFWTIAGWLDRVGRLLVNISTTLLF